MEKRSFKQSIGIILLIGSIWGLTEATLGMQLHNSFQQISGSLMAALAFFFIASGFMITRNLSTIIGMVIIAALFKLLDAFLLAVPVNNASILNPVFGFITQGVGFLVLFGILKEKGLRNTLSRAGLGGGAALISVLLFPMVRLVTGFPACLYVGTNIPLSIYFAPVAITLSILLVPLGFLAGERLNVMFFKNEKEEKKFAFATIFSPLFFLLSLMVLVLIRMI